MSVWIQIRVNILSTELAGKEISLWQLYVAMATRVPIPSAQKTNAAFPLTLMMLYMKFDQIWPNDLRYTSVNGRQQLTDDDNGLRTDGSMAY